MIKIYDPYYTVAALRAEPAALFIFGDNTERFGKGGQAIIRDEPNAHGIATKLTPSQFMKDEDVLSNIFTILKDLQLVTSYLRAGKTVYWPRDGIGTGLSAMPSQCPLTFEFLVFFMDTIFAEFGDEDKKSTWGR